jgi:outer membrane protein assembly factor BamB
VRRVADDAKTPLSYHPIVAGGLVFVAGQDEILAFDLRTGAPAWGQPNAAVYRDRNAGAPSDSAAHDLPNVLGATRFTLTACGDRLYARTGSALSGPATSSATVRREGFLVCLDLKAEGRLVFPPIKSEAGWTFEGAPISDGNLFYVATRRHEIQPQLHVAAFDAETGQSRWRQFVLAADTPAGANFFEATNNLLTLYRDTLYYNTNAGAVAALATQDGRLRWVSRYPRVTEGDLLKPAPHLDRDLVPCLYDRGTLLVAPADSRRIFCFDAATGQILWQTGPEVEDVVHLLGVVDDQLIAGGHRLYWISLRGPDQGRVRHGWPDSHEKLGYGRGILAGDCVWWPTRDKIYLFESTTGRLKKEIQLAPRGLSGGNLVVAQGHVLVATGNELVALGQTSGGAKDGAGRLAQREPRYPPSCLPTTISKQSRN